MLQWLGKRKLAVFLSALYGGLAWSSAASAQAWVATDAIDPPCVPVQEYHDDAELWWQRQFPTSISVDIAESKQRAWIQNLLRTLMSRKRNISLSARKNFDATVSWEINGHRCTSAAKVRLNGDAKDHISYTGATVISSVAVKLLEGHIGNAVRFKLLLPETRVGEREIIAILMYREFGFLAPESRMVTGFLNGIETDYLFQASPAKEFMEVNGLRESVLIEGDERWGWLMHSRPDVYADRLIHDAVWVENRSYGRADNRGWLDNPTAISIAVAGLTTANKLYNQYHIDKPARTGQEDHLGMSSSYRLDQNSEIIKNERLFVLLAKVLYASHGLRLHNRKFYFDPMYQHLIPIYYDGMPLRAKDNRYGRFPRHGTFPAEEIELVASKLSDAEVRDRIYESLRDRGGTMLRDEYEGILDEVLARTLALEPRVESGYVEPESAQALDLPLLLADEEQGRYDFYGYDVVTDAFKFCGAWESGNDYTVSCAATDLEPKQILAEPESPDGDPVPFVGAFLRENEKEFRLTVPDSVREFRQLNPRLVDANVEVDEMLVIEFSSDYDEDSPPVIKVRVNSTDAKSGKVIVLGDVPDGALFEVAGSSAGTEGLTRYDTRLLTGCLTFVDAQLSDARIISNLGPCEDAVNFVRSDGHVKELIINGAMADAVDADFSRLEFDTIRISDAANDCIDLSAGFYEVGELNVSGCADKGLSVGEKAVVEIERFVVSDAGVAAAVKDSSYVRITDTSLERVAMCFATYRKKQEFGGARLEINTDLPEFCDEQMMFNQSGSAITVGSE